MNSEQTSKNVFKQYHTEGGTSDKVMKKYSIFNMNVTCGPPLGSLLNLMSLLKLIHAIMSLPKLPDFWFSDVFWGYRKRPVVEIGWEDENR